VNSGHRLQVVCIEQILRRKHSGKSAHITQIKWNGDPASLPALIRSSARAGAQVLTVSDVPDSATLRALIEASRAGCLVIAATLARSLQQMIEDFCQMTGDENGFIDGSCPWRGRFIEELRWVVHQLLFRDRRQGLLLPVREILLVTPTAKEAIRTGNLEPLHDIIKGGRPVGMAGRDDALKKLVYEGRLSLDEATRWCHSLPEFAVNKVFSEGQGRGKL